MKRPTLFILFIALILTSSLLWYNRNTPVAPQSRMAGASAESPLLAGLGYVEGGASNLAFASGSEAATIVETASQLTVQNAVTAQPLAGEVFSAGLQRKIIGRATLELVVEDADAVVAQIGQLMTTVGGYVANANLYHSAHNGEEYLQGSLNLRVPAVQMEATLAKLERMGKEARARSLNREDVTDQYTDLDAQLRNLKATENELRELLAEVRKKPNARPDDILTVHRSMTDIRSQIEQLQGRKNMLDNLIDLSTIDVTLAPHVVSPPIITAEPEPEKGWQPMMVVRSTVADLVSTMQGFADVGIWLVIYFVPVVAMVCIPVVILYLLWRMAVVRWQRRSLATGAGD